MDFPELLWFILTHGAEREFRLFRTLTQIPGCQMLKFSGLSEELFQLAVTLMGIEHAQSTGFCSSRSHTDGFVRSGLCIQAESCSVDLLKPTNRCSLFHRLVLQSPWLTSLASQSCLLVLGKPTVICVALMPRLWSPLSWRPKIQLLHQIAVCRCLGRMCFTVWLTCLFSVVQNRMKG